MASLFRPALDLMTQYAAYHRDRRNITTHFIGIPLIAKTISGMPMKWVVMLRRSRW